MDFDWVSCEYMELCRVCSRFSQNPFTLPYSRLSRLEMLPDYFMNVDQAASEKVTRLNSCLSAPSTD